MLIKMARKSEKKTRDLERSRKEILDVAFMEVYRHGFQGVSVDDIVKKTSLTKGAFYHSFPAKLDLGYALVEEVISPMIVDRWIEPLKAYDNPLDGILKQMRVLMGESADLSLGCPLNNLVQEMAPLDAGFRKRLQAALNLWIDEMDAQLKRAKKNGFIREDVSTREVAHFVVMSHEGFFGMLKGFPNDPQVFRALYNSIKRFFATIQTNKQKGAA